MIQRLRELQTEEAKSHFSSAKTPQNLPQDSQVEAAQTSSISADQREKMKGGHVGEEEDSSCSGSKASSKLLSQLGSAQKTGGCGGSSGSGSTRLLPGFVYQASPDPASRETEDRQGGRGGGGKRRAVKENGRKAKQKLNFTSSCRTEEEAERNDSSEQPANISTWSEMSSMVIGSDYRLSPLSTAMEQRLILQYLTPLGDYQEVRLPTNPSLLLMDP